MATPLYKIPSTPVYAFCSDFVVLLIFRHIFPVLHPTQIELHTLHQLNSIRVWKESKERAALIPPSSSFFTTIPDPNLPSSLSPIPFLFSNTASRVKTLANPASQVLVTSLISQSRNLAFSRVPHYISVNPESREFSSGSMVLHSNYKCSLKLPLAGSPHNPFFTYIIPLEYHTFELNSIKEFI